VSSLSRWTILAVIFGASLRFFHIGSLSLWFDEGYTAWVIQHPPHEIIRLIRADTSPPLYYLLLHYWAELVGHSETALRSFSAVLGVATIPIVAGIARRLLKDPIAVVAATWLFVFSFMQNYYSQEARNYELTAFLIAAIIWSLLAYLNQPKSRWIVLLIAAATAAMYADSLTSFYLAAIALAAFFAPSVVSFRHRIRDGLVATTFIALAYLPWLSVLKSQIRRVNQAFWLPRPTLDAICDCLSRPCGVGHFWTWDQFIHPLFYNVANGVPRAGALLLICGIIAGIGFLRGSQRRTFLALAIIGIAPPLAEAVYSLWNQPIFYPSHAIGSTIVLPILMASPLAWARSRRFAGAIVAGMLILCAVNLAAEAKERTKEDWRGAAALVSELYPSPKRLIVFVANEGQLPFDYYFHSRHGEVETGAPAGFFDIDPPRTQRRVLSDRDLDGLRRKIESGGFSDFVLVVSHTRFSDPDNLTSNYVLDATEPLGRYDFSDQAITVVHCVKR
jgi:mannosyltransferase